MTCIAYRMFLYPMADKCPYFHSAKMLTVAVLVALACPTVAQHKMYNAFAGSTMYELHLQTTAMQDTGIGMMLQLYRDSLSIKMEESLIENDFPLTKALPESTLGNWIADAAKNTVGSLQKVDVCMLNYGSIGKDYIGPGPIRRKDVYELLPHDNKLLLISVSGALLNKICDTIAQINGLPVSGLQLVIDSAKATNIKVNGQPVNENLVYTLLVNDYLPGSRSFAPLIGKLPYKACGKILRNVLFQYAEVQNSKGMHVRATLENRISYAN